MLRQIVVVCLFLMALGVLSAQYRTPGDAAVADSYVAWIQHALAEERWADAKEALQRAHDFIDVASDISYLQALLSLRENSPRRLILQTLRQGIEANRWRRYNADAARLLEAEFLIHIRAYAEALETLARISPAPEDLRGFPADTSIGSEVLYLRLRALLGLKDYGAFRNVLGDALEQYSQDPRMARLLFRYGAQKNPEKPDLDLIAIVLRRLPLLIQGDPELAYLAAPFIKDPGESYRLAASYWAQHGANPEAVPIALSLGVIDEEAAIRELFRPAGNPDQTLILDKALILSVFGLLRHNEGRDSFKRNLISFSGVLFDDVDRDGIPEAYTRYQEGYMEEYTYDEDQDGEAEWRILFRMGTPVRAEIAIAAEAEGERIKTAVTWEQYPWALRAVLGKSVFTFRPRDFAVTLVRFTEIGGSFPLGLLYPDRDVLASRLTKRSLGAFAAMIEQPSGEFAGAVERIELARGVPLRGAEYLHGRIVSITEFLFGLPRIQQVDRDLDGRLETIRYFRREAPPPVNIGAARQMEGYPFEYRPAVASAESDWDGDGIYETGEEYFPDGTVNRSWDINKDGIKEFTIQTAEH